MVKRTSPSHRKPSPDAIAASTARAEAITREMQAKKNSSWSVEPVRAVTAKSPIPKKHTVRLRPLPMTERQFEAIVERAKRKDQVDRLNRKWQPWEGTPETNERIARVPERRRQWPMDRMHRTGAISNEEHLAAQEICSVVEMIERAVNVRCASLEARVDNSGSARDVLVESIGRIRMEVAYDQWRQRLPKPPRMILDMILTNQPYVAIARAYNVPWRKARKLLLTALRNWPGYRILANKDIGRDDVEAIYGRLGEGVVLVPMPKGKGGSE